MVPNRVIVAPTVAASFRSTRRAPKPGQEVNEEMSTPQPSSTPAAMQKKPTYARSARCSEVYQVQRILNYNPCLTSTMCCDTLLSVAVKQRNGDGHR